MYVPLFWEVGRLVLLFKWEKFGRNKVEECSFMEEFSLEEEECSFEECSFGPLEEWRTFFPNDALWEGVANENEWNIFFSATLVDWSTASPLLLLLLLGILECFVINLNYEKTKKMKMWNYKKKNY